jgi:hypothetical protein
MSNPTMLFKYPGQHLVDRDKYDYVIIDSEQEQDFNTALSEGWSKTPAEAKALTERLVSEETQKPKSKK